MESNEIQLGEEKRVWVGGILTKWNFYCFLNEKHLNKQFTELTPGEEKGLKCISDSQADISMKLQQGFTHSKMCKSASAK